MKFPSSEKVSHANAIAMNEIKGKPRKEGYPVSNRTEEFKGGSMMWNQPAGSFPTAYETSRNRLTSMESMVVARKTR